jgi:hypothetical protein
MIFPLNPDFLMVKPGFSTASQRTVGSHGSSIPQVALALPLAALLDQALPGVAVGAVSGVSSMTEEQRAVAEKLWGCGKHWENKGKY